MTDRSGSARVRRTLELEPLDVLFCGGGRTFGPATRVASGLPTPQMVAGAVRTWLLERCGADFAALGSAVRAGAAFAAAAAEQGEEAARVARFELRGPWFALDGERLAPMPSTVQVVDAERGGASSGALCRLDPLSPATTLPGWSPPAAGMRPMWRRSADVAKPRGGFLRPRGLARFLAGGVPRPDHALDEGAVFSRESRHGIGVDCRRRTASDGLIYQIEMLRLHRGVTLQVDLLGAEEDLAGLLPDHDDALALGGESRRSLVRQVSDRPPWPPTLPQAVPERAAEPDGGLLLLTTAAPFDGWRPQGLDLIAASASASLPVSGWDLAHGGPKPTRFAVPAGSVYFLAPGAAPPPDSESLCQREDKAAGWGAFLPGDWSYA